MAATSRQKVKIGTLGVADLARLLAPWVPEASVDYAAQLWHKYQFSLKVAPPRQTRLGDYTWKNQHHYITVNQDLNLYAWLITYLHEVAHLEVRLAYPKTRVAPHGAEWKTRFQALLRPVMSPQVFPAEVLRALQTYLQDPKASSCSDPALMRSLKLYDEAEEGAQPVFHLEQLSPGQLFRFRNKTYRLVEKRRTRYLCTEQGTGRQFLIAGIAEVEPV